MVLELINALGSWGWIVFGLLLLVLEVVLPSVFFLWFGIAALIVGLITLALGTDSALWPWQAQWISFALLSLIALVLGRNYMKNRENNDAADMLNKRGERWVGSTSALLEPAENNRSRIKLGDTTWSVKIDSDNDKLAKGTKVKVIDVDANVLIVEVV